MTNTANPVLCEKKGKRFINYYQQVPGFLVLKGSQMENSQESLVGYSRFITFKSALIVIAT